MIEIVPFLLGVLISISLVLLGYSVLGTFRGKKEIKDLNYSLEKLHHEVLDDWEEVHRRIDVEIEGLHKDIETLKNQLDSRFDKLRNYTDERFSEVNTGVPKSIEKLNQVEQKLGNFVGNLGKLDERVSDFIKSYQNQ